MSEPEQAVYPKLKKRAAEIQNEMVALEADLKQAADGLATLVGDLARYQATRINWKYYQGLTARLPEKIGRLNQLASERKDIHKQLDALTEPTK